MAEFQKIAKERERMCESVNGCKECPMYNLTQGNFCGTKILNHPEESERIIMKWAKENPLMTNRMKFKEVFGFDYTDEFCATHKETEWLNAEYKGGQNENQNN